PSGRGNHERDPCESGLRLLVFAPALSSRNQRFKTFKQFQPFQTSLVLNNFFQLIKRISPLGLFLQARTNSKRLERFEPFERLELQRYLSSGITRSANSRIFFIAISCGIPPK